MIEIGTCSWVEKSLLDSGEFYPRKSMSAEERLKHYCGFFSTVEINSSYYSIPDRTTAARWAERTPDDFMFHVKAYGALTGHGVDPRTLPEGLAASLPPAERGSKSVFVREPSRIELIAERFAAGLRPLAEAGKLGHVLFQFPPWFRHGTESFAFILRCRELIGGFRMAAEFRHGSWLSPDHAGAVLNFLAAHGITYVTADEPQFGSLATVPYLPAVTTDTAYFRFHGRNSGNWLRRGIETSLRYDYLYSDEELGGFRDGLIETSRKASKTYGMFNNCHGASAVRNARRLKEMLEAMKRR